MVLAVLEGEVELTFRRADNPSRQVVMKAHVDDDFVDYVIEAAKKLGFGPGQRIGVAGTDGLPVGVEGRTVREVVLRRGTVFNITSEKFLGR